MDRINLIDSSQKFFLFFLVVQEEKSGNNSCLAIFLFRKWFIWKTHTNFFLAQNEIFFSHENTKLSNLPPPLPTGSSPSWKCKYGKMKKNMLSQFSILLDNYVRGVVGDFEEAPCEGGGMVMIEEEEDNEKEEMSKERREREQRREEARKARRRRARRERRRQEKLVKKKTEKMKAKKREKAVKKVGGTAIPGGEQEYVLTSLAGEVVRFSDGNMKEMYINLGNQDKCVFCSSVFGPYKTPSNRRYGLFFVIILLDI